MIWPKIAILAKNQGLMAFEIELKYQSDQRWLEAVMNDFDAFLIDHADCERKASAMAMTFVAKCPDKSEMIPHLIETAVEELMHFKQVYEHMEKRGLKLPKEMQQDPYMKSLLAVCRSNQEERLLDRMIVASIVEARGCERFRCISEAIEDDQLKTFYKNLYLSEAKHSDLFLRLANEYFDREDIEQRLEVLLEKEAEICKNLKPRAALH